MKKKDYVFFSKILEKKYLESEKKEAKKNIEIFLKKEIKDYKNVLSFCNKKEEVDLSDFNIFLAKEKKLILPKTFKKDLMFFSVKDPLKDLILHPKYKIFEPNPKKCEEVESIDIVLVPGIVFDKNGNRLGYGKGYYDRLLSKIKIKKIGIGFKEQLYKKDIPIEKHDISMDKLLLV